MASRDPSSTKHMNYKHVRVVSWGVFDFGGRDACGDGGQLSNIDVATRCNALGPTTSSMNLTFS